MELKYEKLNKIEATRKVWPAGKNVKIQAYEAQYVDEALQEIVNWYKTTKDELETLKESANDSIKELNMKIGKLEIEIGDYKKEIAEQAETISNYKLQIEKVEKDIAEKNDLIKSQSETILRQNVNTSHGLEEIDKLKEVIEKQKADIEAKEKNLAIHKHNLEEERLAVKVLNEKNIKIEEKLNSLTNTLDKIYELGVYYKNYEKGC